MLCVFDCVAQAALIGQIGLEIVELGARCAALAEERLPLGDVPR
jgi:hypothetical protein